ncbi:unnamed protein product [Tuber aestivum]|uniref:Uncharacterized protein n=1 Tax=Tuber aestivum TaxID=59557 RepID=A0A292PIX6_9PEZI|nr:unnamed protein product [Tuber aestivum]
MPHKLWSRLNVFNELSVGDPQLAQHNEWVLPNGSRDSLSSLLSLPFRYEIFFFLIGGHDIHRTQEFEGMAMGSMHCYYYTCARVVSRFFLPPQGYISLGGGESLYHY